jgi:hypothetical protein
MSEIWQWAFGIIGLVAFLMAIQPFIQAIWGRPKLVVDFKVECTDNEEFLNCLIRNIPVTNRILKMLFVYRNPIDDLFAQYKILAQNDRKQLSAVFKVKFQTQQGQKLERITLPASYQSISFPIIAYDKKTSMAFTMGIAKDKVLCLKGGVFLVQVDIFYGARRKTVLEDFVVADNPQYIRIGEQLEYNM